LGQAAVRNELSEKERADLTSLSRAQKTGQALATRARIVLAAADGLHNSAICETVGVSANKSDQGAPAGRPGSPGWASRRAAPGGSSPDRRR